MRALDIDIVAENFQVLQLGCAVVFLRHVELNVGAAARGFGPAHAAEQQLRIGEIGVETHIRRGLRQGR